MSSHTDLVRRHFEHLWNERDLDACDELMADVYVEHALAPFGSTEPGEVHGPTAMRETMHWLLSQFSDLTMHVEAVVAEGDVVAARVRTTGTNDGPLNGVIPPTGKAFDSVQTHWFRVADGKLAEHWATRDDLTTMLQLGIIPRPGPPPGVAASPS